MGKKAKILNMGMKNKARAVEVNQEFKGDVIYLSYKEPEAYAVLFYIVNNIDGENVVRCEAKDFAEITGFSILVVKRSLNVLVAERYIEPVEVEKGKVWYRVNPALARLRPS